MNNQIWFQANIWILTKGPGKNTVFNKGVHMCMHSYTRYTDRIIFSIEVLGKYLSNKLFDWHSLCWNMGRVNNLEGWKQLVSACSNSGWHS